tara:strand:- start:758 stop:1996 length:1239 start_codon:yes stop_codon:yes gene_type:complete
MGRYDNLKFRGSNKLNSLDNFKERMAYSAVFPTQTMHGRELPSTIDFWNNPMDLYYGRIDPQEDSISPNPRRMKTILAFSRQSRDRRIVKNPMYVFDFVADAFNQFQKYMNFGPPAKKIKDSPWQGIAPLRAWNGNDLYNSHMDAVMTNMHRQHLRQRRNGKKMFNAKTFVKMFFNDYAKNIASKFPLTNCTFNLSSNYNVMHTGLCIDLSKDSHSEDFGKYKTWIRNKSFDYFRHEAANHGFLVDKNAPWRLVANINSPIMKQMMRNNNVLDSDFFEAYYTKTYYNDVAKIKNHLFSAYNNYVRMFPKDTIAESSMCGHRYDSQFSGFTTKTTILERNLVTREDFDKMFDEGYWLEQYFALRLIERKISINKRAFNRHVKKIILMNKMVDYDSALGYINSYVKDRSGLYDG